MTLGYDILEIVYNSILKVNTQFTTATINIFYF